MENNNKVNNLEKETKKNEQTNNIENNKKHLKNLKIILIIIIIIIILSTVGIFVYATISINNYQNTINHRPSSSVSDSKPHVVQGVDLKPVIYLYPQEEIQVSVKLGKENNITCSYPEYKNGWNVIAKPDGTLTDVETGRTLYCLYWEGIHSEKYDLTEGFVVKGDETIEFLEEKLSILGLNELEAQEFIIYWLPILQENEYNYIRFATLDEINNNMPLELSVKPDTLIRVLMQYKPLDEYVEVKEQKLVTPERKGFTVVEWGGTEIK